MCPDISRGGVQTGVVQDQRAVYEALDYRLPDVVSYLQNETNLTRRTLVDSQGGGWVQHMLCG